MNSDPSSPIPRVLKQAAFLLLATALGGLAFGWLFSRAHAEDSLAWVEESFEDFNDG